MVEEIFKLTRANFKKLEKFGFKKEGEVFALSSQIVDGQLTLTVTVDGDSNVRTRVVDNATGDDYILHLVGGVGSFVGRVRAECEEVLLKIKDECFEREVFKSDLAKKMIEFIKREFGDDAEFLWEKFPTDAIWRRKDNQKWYALIMAIPKNRLGFDSDEMVEVVDVRAQPETIERLVDGKQFFRGYHMNKQHWLTFMLDGSTNFEQIKSLILESHELAK